MDKRYRVAVLIVIAGAVFAYTASLSPIAQDPTYPMPQGGWSLFSCHIRIPSI
jgi:hypothetical protein